MAFKTQMKELPVRDPVSKKRLMEVTFSKGKFTRNQIKNEIQKISDRLKKDNQKGMISSTLFFGKDSPLRWGGAQFQKFGKPVKIFNIIDYPDLDQSVKDPEYFQSFKVYIRNM